MLPLLMAVILSMLLFPRFSRHSLYTPEFHEKGIDLVRGKEEGVLRAIPVREAMREDLLEAYPRRIVPSRSEQSQ